MTMVSSLLCEGVISSKVTYLWFRVPPNPRQSYLKVPSLITSTKTPSPNKVNLQILGGYIFVGGWHQGDLIQATTYLCGP